ncbi:MAG TPA: DnaD domain protein [Chloroflexi bacterium]|nr:DnaD domain protein [Chloroflexota bacterium]HPO57304.1 DnaD domain protein [Anaerolineaceae bacterium]
MKRPGRSTFSGFPAGKVRFTPIPGPFFTDLLPEIDHLGELKVLLYTLWRLDRMDGHLRYLTRADYLNDPRLMEGLARRPEEAAQALEDALERAVQRSALLRVMPPGAEDPEEELFFLNTARGRAAIAALRKGAWRPDGLNHPEISLEAERPNIYLLYEQNIGPLTPMIAETLRDAEQTYPEAWIEEAMRTAVQKNIRNWRYIEAILRAWKERGRDEEDRRDPQADYRRYLEDEFADFTEH